MNKLCMWGIAAGLVAAMPAFSQTSYMASVLLERGKTALERGDISSARALLKRPADNGVAEASRCLAQTYDPVWLTKHHVVNMQSFEDADMAAQLYLHAAHLGDPVAIAKINAQ